MQRHKPSTGGETQVLQAIIRMSSSLLLLNKSPLQSSSSYMADEKCAQTDCLGNLAQTKQIKRGEWGPIFGPHTFDHTQKKRSISIIYCGSCSRPQNVGVRKERNETVA